MYNATILKNTRIASGIFKIVLRFDDGAGSFQPGQFAHIKLPDETKLLRRPFSFNHVDAGEGSATFVYQLVGGGTTLLSTLKKGEKLDVLAPLGRGFWKPEGMKKAALIGGGMGAAPLRMLPEAWPEVAFDVYFGFRGKRYSYQMKEFETATRNVSLCSDDGSLGEQGFVTCLLDGEALSRGYDALFACGPAPMLKALQEVLKDAGIPCQVSLEERMGCGVGACLVCNCRVRDGGWWRYLRVCKDGPVFDLAEVDFDGQA
jgi:dihydroorotate dehydrogenase electron transfer subunit